MNKFLYLIFTLIFCIKIVNCAEVENGIECYNCIQTDKDDICLYKPETAGTITCNTNCYTRYDKSGEIHRGCSSKEAFPEDDGKCVKPNCIECDKTKCNKDTFPEDRIQCYTCENCLKITDQTEKFCSKYSTEIDCFIDSKNKNRGCSSDKNNCEKSDTCSHCSKSKCNEDDLTPKYTCYMCNSDTDENCKRPKVTTNGKEECSIKIDKTCERKTEDEECYTDNKNGKIVRGCASDGSEDAKNGKKCKGENCNKECIEDIKKCFTCDSTDEKCSKDDGLSSKDCPTSTSVCFRCEDVKGGTSRGCGIKDDKNLTCSYCYNEDNCKPSKPITKCYACNSRDKKECAHEMLNVDNSEECTENEDCVVYLKENYIVRSCFSKMTDKCEDGKCKKCSGSFCNGIVYPDDRLQCFQCQGDEECNLKQEDPKLSIPCQFYKKDDKCYAYENDNKMFRGCQSDDNDKNQLKCKNLKEKCVTCDAKGCNSMSNKAEPFECIQCAQSDSENKCEWGHNENEAKKCAKQVEYWKTDKCYTLIDDKNLTKRGCLSDIDKCVETDPNKCFSCDTKGCNTKSISKQTCIRCRSDFPKQSECGSTILNITPTECEKIVTYERRGCYMDKTHGVVFRGCMADLTDRDHKNCVDKTYSICSTCDKENGCNKEAYSSSPTIINKNNFFNILIIAIILKMIN